MQKDTSPVSVGNISKWIQDVLMLAGIDAKQFSNHGTRAASVSCANKNGFPLQDFMSAEGWSSAGTSQKFKIKLQTYRIIRMILFLIFNSKQTVCAVNHQMTLKIIPIVLSVVHVFSCCII